MKKKLRILIAAGGTAGHINPAIAVADYIKEHCPDCTILFVGRSDGMEAGLVAKAGYNFQAVEVHGFQRKVSLTNVRRNAKAAVCLAKALPTCRRILRRFKPDIVFGTGGYMCGPLLWAAQDMKIKTAIHESNAFAGVTNKLLARRADIVFVVSEAATKGLGVPHKTIVSGNPVRQEILLKERCATRNGRGIPADALVILSFGGSLGARCMNDAVAGLMKRYTQNGDEFIHYHATGRYGKKEFKRMSEQYGFSENKNIHIKEYIDDMPSMLAVADIVIARAGAITVSEVAASGNASILIPSPNVAENHQYYNAKQLSDEGAAILILEKDLTSELLYEHVKRLNEDRGALKEMAVAAKSCWVQGALHKIYIHMEKLLVE